MPPCGVWAEPRHAVTALAPQGSVRLPTPRDHPHEIPKTRKKTETWTARDQARTAAERSGRVRRVRSCPCPNERISQPYALGTTLSFEPRQSSRPDAALSLEHGERV